MLLFTKEQQKEKRIERARELIAFCGGIAHLLEMIGEDRGGSKAPYVWKDVGIPEGVADKVAIHPTVPSKFNRDYLLALDKVDATA